jgi:hypothetical protein
MYRLATLYRLQMLLLMGCAIVTLFHWSVNIPLSRKTRALDHRLAEARANLLDTSLRNPIAMGLEQETINENHLLVQRSLKALRKAATVAKSRIEFAPEIQQRAKQPFQLLDFDQYRLQTVANLQRFATEKKVTLETNALAGLPEYTSGKERPSWLWVQLAITDYVLAAAINSSVSTIRSTTLLPSRTLISGGEKPVRQEEFSLRVELTGPMNCVMAFLLGLPIPGAEMKNLKMPDSPRPKPALFVNKIIMKSTGANPNEVSLDAVISGLFVPEKVGE